MKYFKKAQMVDFCQVLQTSWLIFRNQWIKEKKKYKEKNANVSFLAEVFKPNFDVIEKKILGFFANCSFDIADEAICQQYLANLKPHSICIGFSKILKSDWD